jgi:hypothetical protein
MIVAGKPDESRLALALWCVMTAGLVESLASRVEGKAQNEGPTNGRFVEPR